MNGKYWGVVHDVAKFIYPKKIEMSPYDCDQWVMKKLGNFYKTRLDLGPDFNNYYFDKVVYWRLEKSKNVTIKRDREWFSESLPLFRKIWSYVLFLRKDKTKLDMFVRYINSRKIKRNKDIMKIMEQLYDVDNSDYEYNLSKILENIENMEKDNKVKNGYMFD